MISRTINGTINASQMKLYTVIAPLKTFQNTKKLRNLTYGLTMTSLLKQRGNSDLRKTGEIIYHSKGNDESFQKMKFLMKMSDWIKSYGHLRKKFSLFQLILPDLSLIIFKSRNYVCHF